MSKNRRHELGVGVLVLVALTLLAYMALKVGALQGMGDHIDLVTRLPDAAGLADGALVKVAGVNIGRVSSLGIEGDHAIVHLEIQTSAQIRKDAVATVRARSVLGEKFVELQPQSQDAALAVDGDRLKTAATPVEIDELVNQIAPLVAALDPAELSKSLKILNDALARDPNRVDRMLTDLETTLHSTAQASQELPSLVEDTRATLGLVRQATGQARPVLAHTDQLVTQIQAGTADLGATRAELDDLLTESRGLLQHTDQLIGRVDGNFDKVELVLDNLGEIDKVELRRLLREEGILVRIRRSEVVEPAP